jgi:cation diffusion facilitator CzcD-associated flavoprotein CzcO
MALRLEAPETDGGATLPEHIDIAIIGSGFAGLAAGVRLTQAHREFLILERASELGGTWRDNSYPGCACDVPSHLYSFSFALNPDWSRSFSPQEEIFDYLRRTARDFGILPRIAFNAAVSEARWDDAAQKWRLKTTRGEITANAVISGTGGLSEPSIPALPGLENFEGVTFHSATWNHDHDLSGKRVAVIGTGASAIQFVPYVQREAQHMTLFQRTAPWVLPRRDRDISKRERWVYRHVPLVQRTVRTLIYWGRESWVMGFQRPNIMRFPEKQARRFLAKQVPDKTLRKKLRPDFRLGCKRVLMSNDYYPALTQSNVHVETDRIVEVLPHAIVTQNESGERTEHPVDTIIFGTGFLVTNPPAAKRVFDASGRSLADHWAEGGASAFHGVTIAGFPNLFFLTGPNTGLGHNSIVLMIETQVRYIVDALKQMRRLGIGAIEPRPEVQKAYNEKLQRMLRGTVWNAGGCASWYLDEAGRNTTLWPTYTFSFRRELMRCDLGDYVKHPKVRDTSRSDRVRVGA